MCVCVCRRWKVGDTVRVTIPLAFSVMPIADVRPQYATYGAIMMGPYVMAGTWHDTHTHTHTHIHTHPASGDPALMQTPTLAQALAMVTMGLLGVCVCVMCVRVRACVCV